MPLLQYGSNNSTAAVFNHKSKAILTEVWGPHGSADINCNFAGCDAM
jgi:hypothetical protein